MPSATAETAPTKRGISACAVSRQYASRAPAPRLSPRHRCVRVACLVPKRTSNDAPANTRSPAEKAADAQTRRFRMFWFNSPKLAGCLTSMLPMAPPDPVPACRWVLFETGCWRRRNPRHHRWDSLLKIRFAPDSPLEGDGFEPSVPGPLAGGQHRAQALATIVRMPGDREPWAKCGGAASPPGGHGYAGAVRRTVVSTLTCPMGDRGFESSGESAANRACHTEGSICQETRNARGGIVVVARG